MAYRVNHFHLKGPDPEKTARFYVEFMGARITEETRSSAGEITYHLDLHGIPLVVSGFSDVLELKQIDELEHLPVDATDFHAQAARLRAAKVKILEERTMPNGGRLCFFEGPEGVRLEFIEAR